MKILFLNHKTTFKNNNKENEKYQDRLPQYNINSEFEKKYEKPTIAIIRANVARELKKQIKKINRDILTKESELKKQLSYFEAKKQKINTIAQNAIQKAVDEKQKLQIIRILQIQLADLNEQKREKMQQIKQEILALYAEIEKLQMQLEKIKNLEHPFYY